MLHYWYAIQVMNGGISSVNRRIVVIIFILFFVIAFVSFYVFIGFEFEIGVTQSWGMVTLNGTEIKTLILLPYLLVRVYLEIFFSATTTIEATNINAIRGVNMVNSGITKPLKVNESLSTGVGSFAKMKYAINCTGG